MERYYYHGMEFFYGCVSETIELIIKIIQNEGLKTRNEINAQNDERYNHVCLYKKNDDYDYSTQETIIKSARGGWIDKNFVFIISPDILAEKVQIGQTTGFDENGKAVSDLIDEWRSIGNIPTSQIVGLALPYDGINEYLNDDFNDYDDEIIEDKEKVKKLLPMLELIASNIGIFIVNSDEPNFTDILDSSLSEQRNI